MKYSFTALYPPAKAVRQEASRSSWVTFLLMTSRSRWVPASGAKVRPLLRPLARRSIRLMEKLSARRLGRDRFTCRCWQKGSSWSHSSVSGG